MPQNISLEIAEKLFPNETWHKLEENLFIAQSRKDAAAKNKNETEKLEREISFAKIIVAYSHFVVLVPECGKGKHFDAIIDGVPSELKTVNGGLGRVGDRFNDAIKQGNDIYIRLLSDFSRKTSTCKNYR